MGSHAVAFTSSVLRGADATLKGDKNLESYSGLNKDWDDYTALLFSHVDSRGLLLFFNHALHERIAIVSDGSVGERSLYTQIGAVARRVLVVVVDVQARRAASSARDIDARSSGVGGGIGAQLSSDAGGSGGRLDVHAESPVVQRVRAVLGEDELDRVRVNAVFKHDTAEAARRAAVVGRLDSAWALQQFDTQEMTVNLKEWLQATRAIYRVLMYKAVPTVKLTANKVNKICGVDLFLALLEKHAKSGKEKMLMHMTTVRTVYGASGVCSLITPGQVNSKAQ